MSEAQQRANAKNVSAAVKAAKAGVKVGSGQSKQANSQGSEAQQRTASKDVGKSVDKAKAKQMDKSGQTAREQTKIRAPMVPRPKPRKPKPQLKYRTNTPPKNNINKIADKLYREANFPSKEHRELMIKTHGSVSAARAKTKPTVKQLKARLGLAVIEPIIGGSQEATLGAIKVKNRPATDPLRIIGAVATPTAADMAFAYTVTKIAAGGKRGTEILKKLAKLDDAPMWTDAWRFKNEVRSLEKIAGKNGISTADLRTVQSKLKVLDTA